MPWSSPLPDPLHPGPHLFDLLVRDRLEDLDHLRDVLLKNPHREVLHIQDALEGNLGTGT